MEHISKVKTKNTEKIQKEDKRKKMPHLFKPGQSGNPNGRPKGSRNVQTLFNEAFVKLADELEEEGVITSDPEIDIVKNLIKLARNGDIQAIKIYLEYRIGKPKHQDGDVLNLNLEDGFTPEERELVRSAVINAGFGNIIKG